MSKQIDDMSNNSEGIQLLMSLGSEFAKAKFNSDRALKIQDIYGSWGMTYSFRVGIYLWPLPFLFTVLMYVIFKRKKLLGVTQKFILSIMMLNMCYALTSAVRDTVLNLFEMNYGFLDYRVCNMVFISLRVQMIIHATSLWMKTLMSLHHMLLIGFPFKVRQCNLSVPFYIFLFLHVSGLSVLLLSTIPRLEPVALIQDFQQGKPLKRIDGCVGHATEMIAYLEGSDDSIYQYVVILYTQVIPFCVHLVIIVVLVALLAKNVRSLSLLTNKSSLKQVKYVVLMKVNIGLGLSFVLQELPLTFIFLFQFAYHYTEWGNFIKFQSVATSVLSISYSIGKPVNFLIYSSLSSSFRQELKYLLSAIFKNHKIKTHKS